jgi:hypothetical protein
MNEPMKHSLQLFTLSKEQSACPIIPELIHLGMTLYQLKPLTDTIQLTMSTCYGKRVIINSDDTPINRLSCSDFIEIVDYDPVRNILLFIGPKSPHDITPLHWIIHHAKPEIVSLVILHDETNSLQVSRTLCQTISNGKTLVDTAKTILRALQKKPIIVIENKGVLITGDSPERIKETIYQCLEKRQ